MAHQDDTRPEAENGKKNAVRVAPSMGGITKIYDYHPGFQDDLLFHPGPPEIILKGPRTRLKLQFIILVCLTSL